MADSLPSLEDTHGVSGSRFKLDWDSDGGWVPDIRAESFATIAEAFWEFYRALVSVQIWVLDWVLGMDWLDYVLSPLAGLGLVVDSMVSQIGLLSLTLIILAFVVGFWLLKGRYAGGFMELVIGCIIAALATGFLANPMETIGGDRGVIMSSRDAGMDIATGFATDGASFTQDRAVIRDGLKTQLMDVMIRAPHQIINYGRGLDGGACQDVYDDAVGTEDAAATISECAGDDVAETAAAATATTVVNTFALVSTAIVFLLLSVVIVGGTLFAVLLLGWSAIKLLWQLPVGVVSSGTRAQLFRTGASIGLGCILVAMATMFLVAWMKMLLGFYDATDGMPFLVRLYLFNTLVVAGAVFYVLMGTSVRAALRGLADKLAAAGVPSTVGAPQVMPWAPENRARWANRARQAKDTLGVGLGPERAPAPEKNENARTKESDPTPQEGQAMSDEHATPRTTELPTSETSDANPWTAAADASATPAAAPTDQMSARSEPEKLRDRMANATRTITRAGLQAGAAAGGPGTAAAARGSAVIADGLQAMKDRRVRSSTAVVPEPYTGGRGAHVPDYPGQRRRNLMSYLGRSGGRRF